MNKITFVCPIRGREEMRPFFENNIKKYFSEDGYNIIYVVQSDDKPFMISQLRNIGFHYANTEYVVYRDVDVMDYEKLDIIALYKQMGGPFRTYNARQNVEVGDDGEFKKSGAAELVPNGFGGYCVFRKQDWESKNGFTNLCIGWGFEDNMAKKRYDIKTYNHTFYHIKHSNNGDFNNQDTLINRYANELYYNGKVLDGDDGYLQMTYNVVSDKNLSDNIREICVSNIGVISNFKYMALYKRHLIFKHKEENMKTLVCCIGKNENRYIREYVDWYKRIGVTHICLYDNNDIDGERFEEIIQSDIDEGYVTLIDYRGREVCQLQAYTECYKENKNDYDWILFIDCGDEYLRLNHCASINDYLSDARFDNFDLIHVNLATFGDSGLVHADSRPLSERFTHPMDLDKCVAYNFPENYHVSSIVRGGLDDISWTGNGFTHTPSPNTLRCCNGSGVPCDGNSPFTPYDFREAYFAHYTTKTAEEYCNKMRRGFPDQKWDGSRVKNLIETRFFRTNDVTPEKVEVFKEELGIDMSYLLPYKFEGEKSKDVQIYSLCYSKKDYQFMDDEVVTPLQVGAANGTDVCELKDNTGDNISGGNFFYIENTGTYWIWKNVKDAKYKGQMQYRRPLEGIDGKTDFEAIFKDHDVITCKPFNHPEHSVPTEQEPRVIPATTVEGGYAFSNCIDDLYILEMVIAMYHPDYLSDYVKYIKQGENLYYSNGFVMKAEDYDNYSQFLFNCLNNYLALAEIRSQKDLEDHVKYNIEVGKYPRYKGQKVTQGDIKWQTEIGGFLSERIWTLWLLHNFSKERIYETPYIKMEEGMYT